MKGRSRRDSLDAQSRRKRPRHVRHALALAVAALTGASMLLVTDDDGVNATPSASTPSGEHLQTLELPAAKSGATRPEGREPLSSLSFEHAPERVTPLEQKTPREKTADSGVETRQIALLAALGGELPPPAARLRALRPEKASAPADTAQSEPSSAWKTFEVQSGDSLAAVFQRVGLSARDVYDVVNAGKSTKTLARLHPGETVALRLNTGGGLEAVRYEISETRTLLVRQGGDGFQPKMITNPLEARQAFASGTIESSLYASAIGAGLTDRQIVQLAHIFGWDIDFALDLRKGDRFRVVYEELYRDGEKIRNGDILAAKFVNHGETFRAVRFTFPDGDSQYFTPGGKSMRKAFLRTPVDFARVSSEFNPDRLHPVLGYKRPHMGTDYAAPPGTPIKAAGDGKLIHYGRKGGYGNAAVIQHGSRYSTLYAHMRSFRKGLSTGDRVQQGQIIGYVGSSGLVTGPHLHYEFRIDGKHRNPRTVDLPDAEPIADEYRAAFDKQASPLLAALKGMDASPTRVAHNESSGDDG